MMHVWVWFFPRVLISFTIVSHDMVFSARPGLRFDFLVLLFFFFILFSVFFIMIIGGICLFCSCFLHFFFCLFLL